MNEEDFTLYIKCRNNIITDKIHKELLNLIQKLEIKHKEFKYYKIVEIQLEKNYIFYVRFLDMTKEQFFNEKYSILDLEFTDILNNSDLNHKEKFKRIFGNFLRGENKWI